MKRMWIAPPVVWVIAYVAGLSSCTSLSEHTAEPYDRDAAQAAELERAAAQWCSDHGQPAGAPALPFRFDGCSFWPDGDYRDCCQTHDYAYWCGGPPEARAAADEELRACVARIRGEAYGRLMWLGVRTAGHPAAPMYFRWGFGHEYTGCYPEEAPLAAEPR
jgi:hypothetical protein